MLSKFLHVLSVLAFVTGLVGREIVNRQAARAKDIATTEALLGVSGPFERMVVGGSIAVLVFGLTTAAKALGRRTAELQGAFENPTVRTGHVVEFITMFVVLALMVFNPF